MNEYKSLCKIKRQDTRQKKKELDKLSQKVTKIKETVTTSSVVRKNKLCFLSLTQAPQYIQP